MCNIGVAKDAERLKLAGSAGYPGTDEMPHLARKSGGRIQLVDLEGPETQRVTYGEVGPILFRIAHTNIATDESYGCEHWVLTDTSADEPTHVEVVRRRKNQSTSGSIICSGGETARQAQGTIRASHWGEWPAGRTRPRRKEGNQFEGSSQWEV